MITKQVDMYESYDGKTFMDREVCKAYEENALKTNQEAVENYRNDIKEYYRHINILKCGNRESVLKIGFGNNLKEIFAKYLNARERYLAQLKRQNRTAKGMREMYSVSRMCAEWHERYVYAMDFIKRTRWYISERKGYIENCEAEIARIKKHGEVLNAN